MDLGFTDHTALIVGGASGIGLAAARAFASEGAHVVLWDRSENVSDIAAKIADEFSIRAAGFLVDVADDTSVLSALTRTLQTVGRIEHVVHAAATGSGKFGFPFTNLSPSDWPRVLSINIMGMTHVAHALAPHLIEHGGGTMVFIASIAGQMGSPTDPPYSASKAANINFAQCMAKDLASKNIRVNTICPGMVQTPLNRAVWQSWFNQAPDDQRLSYDEWADRKIKALVPIGKWQTSEAVADMIVFVSSARAEHVTGQTINVDGGAVMHS
ncbi:MAG: SDR family oxidoreductase [Planctomycetota bacterium]